jgi:hypothetical protein
MRKGQIKDRVGESFLTNEGYKIKITEYFGSKNVTVKFEDGTLVKNKEYADLIKGRVKNPKHKSVYGIGYFGIGKHTSRHIGGNKLKKYNTWQGMFERCYDKKSYIKHPTYEVCSVAEIWHNYQNFSDWFDKNFKPEYMNNWQLDKDILKKGCKIYSPENCCFVPQEINTLLIKTDSTRGECPIGISKSGKKFKASVKIGFNNKQVYLGTFETIEEAFKAYKTKKEKYIKSVADKYKNKITEETYNALYAYEVEITD